MDTNRLIAALVKQDLLQSIQKHKVNENQLLVISDLSYDVLEALYQQLLDDATDVFEVPSGTTTTHLPSIKQSRREIIPYLINEQDDMEKRSQAFAGKLRNSMETNEACVRWLVIMGEPQQVEIDTFTTTGNWLVKTPSANKTYFDKLLDKYIVIEVPTELRERVRDLRQTLYGQKLSEHDLNELLTYLDHVKQSGNSMLAMANNLGHLHLLPSENEEAAKVQNLKKNQAFCHEVMGLADHLEDLDFWVEEHIHQEEERDHLRDVLRSGRNEPKLLVEHMASSEIKLEQVINLNEQDLSPVYFEGRDALVFKDGIRKFLDGNARVLEITNSKVKLQYRLTRAPFADSEQIGLTINNGSCYIVPGFSVQEAEIEIDLEGMGVLQELSDNRVYRLEIGLLDPEKNNKLRDKKGLGKKVNKFEFFVYTNFSGRAWNVYETNEEFLFASDSNQCLVGWEEQLKFAVAGDHGQVEAELRLDLSGEGDDEDGSEPFVLRLSKDQNAFTVGAVELKQIRNQTNQNNSTSNMDNAYVELVVSDETHQFTLTFVVGTEEVEMSAVSVQSIQEGIIRFLHQDDVKKSLSSDRAINSLPVPFDVKMVGGSAGDHIRFRVYHTEEEGYSSFYSIRYPSLIRELEKEFLTTPDLPFPREYVEATGDIRLKEHPNWDTSFTGPVGNAFDDFIQARILLFEKLVEEKTFKGMIAVNLIPLEQLVDEYVRRFNTLMEAISDLNRIVEQYTGLILVDTVFSTDGRAVMMAPTHPLKIKAALELQKHLEPMVKDPLGQPMEFAYTLGNIQQLNHQHMPPFLKMKEKYYKAEVSPYLFWGYYLQFGESSLVSENTPLLSVFVKNGGKRSSREGRMAGAIRNRMNVFLQSYPHLEQTQLPMTINCFLSKHSQFVFAAIYELAKEKKDLTWNINFLITDLEDAQKQKANLKRRIHEFREEALRTEEEALILRNLHYSIHVVDLESCTEDEIPYAHISLLSNLFETTVTEHGVSAFPPALVNNGLTALPKTYFAYDENSFYTGITLRHDRNNTYEFTAARLMSVIASHDRSYRSEVALFSRTNLQPHEMMKINKIVKRSVWLCFLEKEIGVEKFDSVFSEGAQYYLVDYMNKYSADIGGYDLLTITHRRQEMVSAIQKHLLKDKYNIKKRTEVAQIMLDAINCLSGRWALRLIGGSPTEVSGLIGSLQVFLFYKNVVRAFDPVLEDNRTILSVMIPLDEYMGVSPRRVDGWFEQNSEENYRSCSDDFLIVRLEEDESGRLKLTGKVVEVKFSKDKISLSIITKAKEQIYNARKVLQDRFLKPKYNEAFKRTELADLVYFHVMKFLRNGVYGTDSDDKGRIGTFMRRVYDQILEGRYEFTFDYVEGRDTNVEGEVVVLMPTIEEGEGFSNTMSDNRRILLLFESAIAAIYDQEEAASVRFQRLRNLLGSDSKNVEFGENVSSEVLNSKGELPEKYIFMEETKESTKDAQVTINAETFEPLIDEVSNSEDVSHDDRNVMTQERSHEHEYYNGFVSHAGLFVGQDIAGEAVTISPNVLTKHVAVLGSTGSGKTRLAKAFIEEVTRSGIPSLIIDPQGDIARLIESAGRSGSQATDFYEKAEVRIFTPASNKGIQFSFNPLQMPKTEMLEKINDPMERDEYLMTVFDSTASNLLSVLSKRDDQAHTFLVTVFERLYRMGLTDITIHDLATYLYRSDSYPLEMTEDEVEMLISKSSKNNLVRDLNGLNVGMNRALFNSGFAFDMDRLMQPITPGKVPINIVYLNSLDSDQKKQFCVSVICNELYKWMLKNPSPDLQLAFYIDEVGPYMPPQNVKKPASKDILLRLYKESRKYGIGCILCTQNPGDVDSKILNNANTWCIGKIIPKHFESIKKLVDDSGSQQVPDISDVSNFQSGEFLIVSSEAFGAERLKRIQVRELYTIHDTPYTLEDLEVKVSPELKAYFLNREAK